MLLEIVKKYNEWDKKEKEAKEAKEALKESILEIVGKKAFKNHFITVSHTEEKHGRKPDVDLMKADGIFEKYSVPSSTKESFKIIVKEDCFKKVVEEKESVKEFYHPVGDNCDIKINPSEKHLSKDCSDDTGIND